MERVTISQGELTGSIETTITGLEYGSFKGIPYAAPPLGNLKFSAPRPPEKWYGVYDATRHRSICSQWDMSTMQILDGSEDCLYINVYTPNTQASLPVMIWIHGGGFQSGSGDSYLLGPDHFIEEGVVLVTFNYRLEVLGFLCLDTKEVPGNAGLKDQVMAMRWVRDNIAKFGGDPNNVTIFGESAGAASVTYHLVSPMSDGLFHRAIAQSGTFYCHWTYGYDYVDRAYRLARYLGKEVNDINEVFKALVSVPPVKFGRAGYLIATPKEQLYGTPIYFLPVVEKEFEGQECFMPESAKERLRKGHFKDVPLILGYNSGEGHMFLRDSIRKSKKIHADFRREVPRDILFSVSEEMGFKIADMIKQYFLGDKVISEETAVETVNMLSDSVFLTGIFRFALDLVTKCRSPVYFYRLSAVGKLNFVKQMADCEKYPGACHADDQFYMFKTWVDVEKGSKDWKAVKQVVRMWTNFAKYSNPTPVDDSLVKAKWKPMIPNEFNFMDIDFDLVPGVDPDKERHEFWKSIYQIVEKKKSQL